MFQVQHVDERSAFHREELGTKSKFWFRRTNPDGEFLFKAEERDTGEDWAEKITCELARLLGLPHVHYELAQCDPGHTPGVICENFVEKPDELVLGNQLLLYLDPSYPAFEHQKYKVRAHTVEAVCSVVRTLDEPEDRWSLYLPAGISSALDVFAGYTLLDAWVANQDRHNENWGAILSSRDRRLRLAPTFDHGAALARNLLDSERAERLRTRDANRGMPAFVRRARSAFYVDSSASRSLTTLDAWRAFTREVPNAAILWRQRLAEIEYATLETLLASVPPQRMSEICRTFTLELLRENQTRLLASTED